MIRTIKVAPKVGDVVAFNANKCQYYSSKTDVWHMSVRNISGKFFSGVCVWSNLSDHPVIGRSYHNETFKFYDVLPLTEQ